MLSSDHRMAPADSDRSRLPGYPGGAHAAPAESSRPEVTLLVAGCRGGKTSFLRLLLDTSIVSPRTTKDQLANVAKFVQGSSSHTPCLRSVALDIDHDPDGSGQYRPLGLTLLDTPSLDFRDDLAAARILDDTIRHIDARFVEGIEDDWKAKTGDRYVHLCIYFLDPDQIVPPSVPAPPAPLIPRPRAASFSVQPEHEPVILEPPVTINPLLTARPTLPHQDIAAIRRLSGRVNVLPVIARADILSNDRLAAVKVAIRRDLADAGIGFGIFDTDPPLHPVDELPSATRPDSSNGYGLANGAPSASMNTSTPPTSPTSPPILKLPYALISPDMYSHSDGVARRLLSRHELVQQYTPSTHYPTPAAQFPRGKFTRTYRWGSLDVLDPVHSDFVALRTAIFHHMDTLQQYTRQYLFEKFRVDYTHHQRPSSRQTISHLSHMGSISQQQQQHSSRPILAIDTQPTHRQPIPVQQQHRDVYPGDVRHSNNSAPRPSLQDTASSAGGTSKQRPSKQRTKKITVACNFCRSRKLKCDGGRPACGQCVKRSNPCDYQPQNKRRGAVGRQRAKGEESAGESDSGGEEGSPNTHTGEPSLSPQVPSQPLSRRSSNVGRHQHHHSHDGGYAPHPPPSSLPSLSALSSAADRRDRDRDRDLVGGEPSSRPGSSKMDSGSGLPPPTSSSGARSAFFPDNEIPSIATLVEPDTPAPMSAPTLPPLRPASDLQAQQRRRSATVPGKGTRQTTSSGPKVVACNFCRARKTKCDGAHPACASCARRQLDCNYAHDTTIAATTGSAGSGASNVVRPREKGGGARRRRRSRQRRPTRSPRRPRA
ncbi:unnamed protein product [Cyclocybe aegerita]|uniref:Uncharacterized protein n=1 Tax=Cyclocybe aegerita TaxID=1973307 RepID=A0A8S0WNH9_CYCAE|nr:unnamed protein product [Cyclocybe aegerita]